MSISGRTDAIPTRFTGAWHRRSIAVEGTEPDEDAPATWLQTSSDYAEVRMPWRGSADEPVSCAGRVRWDGRSLRWRRDLDPDGYPAAEDVARVWFEDGLLMRAGVMALPTGPRRYVDSWVQQPGSNGSRLALRRQDGHGRLVQTGDHVVTVVDQRVVGGPYRACYRVRDGDGWTVCATVGPDADLLPEPPAASAVDGATVVLGTKPWIVVEATITAEAA